MLFWGTGRFDRGPSSVAMLNIQQPLIDSFVKCDEESS